MTAPATATAPSLPATRSLLYRMLALEFRLLWRHGVVVAIAVVTVVWAVGLALLPPALAAAVVPAALYVDAAIIGLLFIAAAVLIERRQGTLEALAVSPVRAWQYVAAKAAAFTALATVATVIIAVAAAPTVRPVPLVLAVLLLSPPVLLVAVAVAARSTTITAYLLRVQVPLVPAMLPLAAVAGWLPWPVAWVGPTTGPFRLLEAGAGGPSLTAAEWSAAVVVPVVVGVLLWRTAVRRVRQDLLRAGRLT